MSDASNYTENAVFNHILRNVAMTSPTTVYMSMWTSVTDAEAGTGTEVSGGSYARTAITFGAPTNGVGTNSALVTFPTATADWNGGANITHFGIHDASTGGNLLTSLKALDTPRPVLNGDTPQFAIGAVSVTVA